jgi:integrase
MKQIKTDNAGRVRFLSVNEETRLREALEDRQAQHRVERQQYNEWRLARHLDLYPVLDGPFTDHLQPLVLLAMNTGLRRGELFNLSWADIDLHGRLLTVRGSGAKSGQTRHLPLNDEAFSLLVAWRNQASSTGLVFPSPRTGKRLNNINTSWAGVTATAALEDFNFHDIRHHFASRLVMAGADLITVKELLGHASIDMTMRYSHLAPEHKAAAVALLNH